MDFVSLFESKAKQLFWQELPADHVIDGPAAPAIDAGKSYFVIRLCEMYLATARKLWHQIYPVLHCYIQCGATATNAIVSPAQLRDLGDANLDRIANLNTRLTGPTPYIGEEVSILAGLYAIPGHDSAKALIDIVGSLIALDPSAIGKAVSMAGVIKSGVESILGLDQATLQFGIRDSFNPVSHPLKAGYFAGIATSEMGVDCSQLWVVDGRLMKGKDVVSLAPYADHDYMLLGIERLDQRDDWQEFPDIQAYEKKFSSLAGDTQFSVSEKRSRLAALWPAFVQTLDDSTDLIDPDRDRIASIVADDLLKRLQRQEEGNPFLKAA